MKHIEIEKIVVHAESGSTLTNCIRECIKLAAEEWKQVELIHNEKIYKINPDDLYETVYSKK
jgi:hypothetical protein